METISSYLVNNLSEWNKKCKRPSLFFADEFHTKIVPNNAPIEMIFWYDIINIYSLFVDCMPYLYKTFKKYYNSARNLTETKPLLDIMSAKNIDNNAILSNNDRAFCNSYINAIRELRSSFCHNKICSFYESDKVCRGLGPQKDNWCVFPHLKSNNNSAFNYKNSYKLLTARSVKLIDILNNAISKFIENCSDSDELEWSKNLASWYLGSYDILNRALIHKCNTEGEKKIIIESWKNQLLSTKITENIISECFDELTNAIYDHYRPATPEGVLGVFLERFI
ncbi:hypothetical protein AGMMS49992_08940 [Clostridia bacterium]|nr:hypothetical protein AGMMS49992_08940 [Clostridia bacterium]